MFDIYAFQKDVLDQNAAALPEYFHRNARVTWHCTNELFTVEEFIRANCEYPGQWAGEVERVEQTGDLCISVTRVHAKNGLPSFHVVSFLRLLDDKILSMDEYWGDDGPVPQWRLDKHIGTTIK